MVQRAIEAIGKGYFNIPFYQEHCKKNHVNLAEVHTEEQFLKIPFTVKEDLRKTSPYIRTRTYPDDIFGLFSSTGTTGKKTFYVYNKEDKEKHTEFVRTYFSKIGLKSGGLGAVLGAIGSPVMGHCMMWQFQAMNMGMTLCPDPSPESMIEILENLPVTDVATLPQVASFMALKPQWREIARKSSVERLLLGGDFLSDTRRKLLEDTWDAKAYNCFGMSEAFGPIGNECEEQNGFHYLDKDLYLEIISPDTGLPVAKGEVGVGVYTTLWDKGFPLLRYWSGDLLRMIPEPCKCGWELPRFDYFGRMVDCVRLEDGTWISPKQVEDITLAGGVIHCQIHLKADHTAVLIYDEAEKAPTREMLVKLQELLQYTRMEAQAVPQSCMNLRGLKPKLLVKCE